MLTACSPTVPWRVVKAAESICESHGGLFEIDTRGLQLVMMVSLR